MHNGTTATTGEQIRAWRIALGRTQLDLATAAGTTTRHLSFVETGRSRPGTELTRRLAQALGLPTVATQTLLRSNGAPPEAPTRFHNDASPSSMLLDRILAGHDPLPACAVDRTGTISHANTAYLRLIPDALELTPQQQVDRFFGPAGRRWILNWPTVAWREADRRLRDAQQAADPEGLRLAIRALDLIADTPRPTDDPDAHNPLTLLRVTDTEAIKLRTVILHGDPITPGLDVLRIELTIPDDDMARRWLH